MLRGRWRDAARGGPARRRRRTRRSWGRALLSAAVGVTLAATIGLTFLHKEYGISVSAHGFARQGRLLPARTVTRTGAFAFTEHQDGSPGVPVGYDPCRPIHLIVNGRLAPPGSRGLVREAAARIGAAAGLVLTVAGPTTEEPGGDRPLRDPARYGAGWSPVLVAWTTPARVPHLDGSVVGVGGSASVRDPLTQVRHYVTGAVSLDAPAFREILRRPHGRAQARALVMHELGHVVGLAHVQDTSELMNPENVGLTRLGPGDRAGLAALGSGRCFY
ncbi:MAG: hypothetical protein ACXVEU_13145 [Nocardioidaceae bacterium]